MKGTKHLFWGTLIMGMVFTLVLVGCATTATTGGGGTPAAPDKQAERLAADLNALRAGSATAEGDAVRLSGEVNLTAGLTVPVGVTLDLTADKTRLILRNGAKLTVDGAVNARGHGDQGGGWVDGGLCNFEGAVVINGGGTINLKSKGRLLNIWGGNGKTQLTLDGVTLVGIKDNDSSLVEVSEGGELVMKSGAITGNTRTEGGGGGVGVYNKGTFTMEGGMISGNTTSKSHGGGVFVNNGTFTMSGSASVSGNTSIATVAGGVYSEGSGTFTMSGNAVVSGNTTNFSGGGVSVGNGGTFIMSGSAVVSGNTTKEGAGGVFVSDNATFIMSGSAVVSGNSGSSGKGGGVSVRNSSSTFIMNGGTIYGSGAHLPAGADKSLANTASIGASLGKDFDGKGTAKYGRAGGTLTDFGPATANGGLTEEGGKGTSLTLSVNPDTGALTVTP